MVHSLLLISLSTAVQACTPDVSHVLWTRPADGASAVPTDAVLRVLIGEGDSVSSDFSVSLIRNGVDIGFDLQRENWTGDDLADNHLLLTVVPTADLLPGATYRLKVSHKKGGDSYGDYAVFTVADAVAMPASTAPEVQVISATDTDGLGEAACDWDQVRTFALTLQPGAADPADLAVMALYRTKSVDDSWHLVQVLPVGPDGTDLAVDVRGEVGRDWGSCFMAVQRGGAGDDSEVSELSCAPDPLQPDDGQPANDTGAGRPPVTTGEDGSCRGCSAVAVALGGQHGGRVGALMALSLLALVRRRRRAG